MSTSCIIVLLITAVCAARAHQQYRSDSREAQLHYDDIVRRGKIWQEEQERAPRYKVRVTTKAGKVYESPPLEPYHEVTWRLRSFASIVQADLLIEESIKCGWFHHRVSNTYVPVCELESLQAVVCQ